MSVKFDITRVKANVVADALSRKERVKPKRVWAMAMTIQSGVKGMILGARGEAFDQDNVKAEHQRPKRLAAQFRGDLEDENELEILIKEQFVALQKFRASKLGPFILDDVPMVLIHESIRPMCRNCVRDTKDIRIASNPFLRPYPHTILYHITDFDLAVNISQSFNWEDFLKYALLRLCCYLAEIIVVNLDSSSDNNNSYSYSTSQISTSEEIDYDSPKPPKSLLKWYHYLSDEYKDNGMFWGSKLGCNESDVKPS
ncbi:hypothetical protein Tco_1111195 [Tanacetum coccineum]|uniref:Uncharacterized protein n=1 Tax=Tanacetum coccineum TaxID=301880 RepID=A0ABQ5INA0_9ASTR